MTAFEYQDPFVGSPPPSELETNRDTATAYADFPESRWRRVGASDAEIEMLRSAHDSRTLEEQAEEGLRVSSHHDEMLKAELDVVRESGSEPASSPYNGTVSDVKELVGDDPEKAAKAATFEKSAFGKGRTSLIFYLDRLLAAASNAAAEKNPRDGAPSAGSGEVRYSSRSD